MAKKRITPEPVETGGQEALLQARAELDASIDAKNAGAVVLKLTSLQHALIAAQVPQAEIYRELHTIAGRAAAAIEDEAARTIISGLQGGFAAMLAEAERGDPVQQTRKALAEAITAKNGSLIIRCLGELQDALITAKVSTPDTYQELYRAAGEAIQAVTDPAHRATLRSLELSYNAAHSLGEEMARRPVGPTRTASLPPMTSPKGS